MVARMDPKMPDNMKLNMYLVINVNKGQMGIVIKFVSDLRQICDFLRVLWFPPPITLTDTIQLSCQSRRTNNASAKRKRTNKDLQNTAKKAKDRATRTTQYTVCISITKPLITRSRYLYISITGKIY